MAETQIEWTEETWNPCWMQQGVSRLQELLRNPPRLQDGGQPQSEREHCLQGCRPPDGVAKQSGAEKVSSHSHKPVAL